MGQQQSKDELLYQSAIDGNIEAVKSLCTQGAGLERIDKEGKTPLIMACMDHERYILAKSLIELGANVNAYRPGLHAGTPLHHAAKRGLDHTVRLLLSHGANPFVRNDDCQTPLDVARSKGFIHVVHAIESTVCFFSGWLKEFYGPGFLEAFAPQLLSRKIWVVILPCGSYNPLKPLKLELVIYSGLQDVQPRTVVALWKADIEEPKFHQSDPTLIIFDKSTRTRHKFASGCDSNKRQIQSLYDACRGIPQVTPPPAPHGTQTSAPITTSQTDADAVALAMGINASIQSAMEDRLTIRANDHPTSATNSVNGWADTANDTSQNGWGSSLGGSPCQEASSSGWTDEPTRQEYNGWGLPQSTPTNSPMPTREEHNGWGVPESTDTNNPIQATYTPHHIPPPVQTTNPIPVLASSTPSAPPVPEEGLYEGPIHYRSIDFSPVDFSIACVEHEGAKTSEAKGGDGDGSCVICCDAPVEGACIPCGHMGGCMSCLNEIKTKKGNCPICRTKIKQIIRIYAV